MNKNVIKKQDGITLISLIITIIVLSIITGISIMQGTKVVKKAKAETIETNMLTIKAKAKEYAENVDALNWNLDNKTSSGLSKMETANRNELQEKYGYTLITDASSYNNNSQWYKETTKYTYYELGETALNNMGLGDLIEQGTTYVVKHPLEDGNSEERTLDIIYVNGISYEGTVYYELSKLQEVL